MLEYILIGIIVVTLILLMRKSVVVCVLILIGVVVMPLYFVASTISDMCSRIVRWICHTILEIAGMRVINGEPRDIDDEE